MNAPIDLAALKGRQQMAWASGDYAVIGTTLQIVGESLAEACDLRWDEDVLDVAAGNGNATLAAARRGCQGDVDRLRVDAARPRRRAGARRAPRREVPGGRCRSAAVRGRELRRRAVHVRRDVRARPRDGRRPRWRACAAPADASASPTGRPAASSASCSRRSAATCRRPRACSRRRSGASKRISRRCSATQAAAIVATPRIFNFRYRSAAHFIDDLPHVVRPGAQGLRRAAGGEGRGAGARSHRSAERHESRRRAFAGRAERVPRDRRHPALRHRRMEARLQRRVQRYGWDLAAASYEPLWQAQLASAQDALMARARARRRRAGARRGLRHRADRVRRGRGGRAGGSCRRHRPLRADGRCRAATRRGTQRVERHVRAHGCRDAGPARRRLRRRAVRARPHVHARSGCGDARDAPGACGRAVAWSRRVGRTVIAADGRRCCRSSMPKSRAKCVRCSSAWDSTTRWRACAPTPGSSRSSSTGWRRR